VHQLTDFSDFDAEANARLLRAGTANLVAAAEGVGVDRIIVQSDASAYAPGHGLAVEDDPIDTGSAVAIMERHVSRALRATVLRYGTLYGPGTWYAPGGRTANAVTAGLIPATSSVTSFAHIDDVVAATVQSIDWPVGVYNIVDDEPSSGLVWLPIYAAGLGAPVPATVTLPSAAKVGRGASNAKARLAGWVPEHPSWRDGFPRI
jgi:nucleoside-diphosphate-sugar epimerase